MSSFARDHADRAKLDAFQTRYEELADLTELATAAELVSFQVKSVHERIGLTSEHAIMKVADYPQDKKTILKQLRDLAANGSGFARDSAPTHVEIGQGTLSSYKAQKQAEDRSSEMVTQQTVS